MKEYILYGLIGFLLLYSVTTSFMLHATNEELKECSIKASRQEVQLSKQLVDIERLEIDTKKYKEQKPTIQKQIEYRYKTIKEVDRTCEQKLEAIKELETIFKIRNLR